MDVVVLYLYMGATSS